LRSITILDINKLNGIINTCHHYKHNVNLLWKYKHNKDLDILRLSCQECNSKTSIYRRYFNDFISDKIIAFNNDRYIIKI